MNESMQTLASRLSENVERRRFLSQEDCAALLDRVQGAAKGGGLTIVSLDSSWTANLRFGRNTITTSGDVLNNDVWVTRVIDGAHGTVVVNSSEDADLHAAVRRAERLTQLRDRSLPDTPTRLPPERLTIAPDIFSQKTYGLDAGTRADTVGGFVKPATAAGMFSAGYLQVSAVGRSVASSDGRSLYYPFTSAQYSVTVRSPDGAGSGWAGVDWSDWAKIDGPGLSAIALDKCLRSRNPVRLEPGRYTTVLEPQAVCDLCESLIGDPELNPRDMDSGEGENAYQGTVDLPAAVRRDPSSPYWDMSGPKIGQRMLGDRISITADPMDPMLGFVPFNRFGQLYRSVSWFGNGVLQALGYTREIGVRSFHVPEGLLNSGAWHMTATGPTTPLEEMIATTTRGVYVTRFTQVTVLSGRTLLTSGYTRDGLWLIENGKISKPIKNFRFTMSPFFALNNIEQIGVPQRVFHPRAPIVAPPLKVRDFNFTSLTDAI